MNTRSFGLNQQSVRSDLRADDVTETSEPEERRQHMFSNMGSNSLSNPMSNKPLKHGGSTRDWTPLSNPMSDKPIRQNLFDMASDRIVQSHVGQTCRTGLSDIASDDEGNTWPSEARGLG
ncbi:hypothetical protein PCANC_06141 [Puccinia coronata f. sp. avenae]|uniref:Uncharacterized protein n=1 Tax=Puccinia coronata f. sp. avenae TaxID=200324 RepID=A0A2N5VTE0_9BASI|nr:hypothetical protein PCANC_06141 [Puccinia coronata f. sp. avenae]